MGRNLFEPGVAYPTDEMGDFVELYGTVTGVSDKLVTVDTDAGTYSGVCELPEPKIGYEAKIRIYRIGGGWYPDHRVTEWSSTRIPRPIGM